MPLARLDYARIFHEERKRKKGGDDVAEKALLQDGYVPRLADKQVHERKKERRANDIYNSKIFLIDFQHDNIIVCAFARKAIPLRFLLRAENEARMRRQGDTG